MGPDSLLGFAAATWILHIATGKTGQRFFRCLQKTGKRLAIFDAAGREHRCRFNNRRSRTGLPAWAFRHWWVGSAGLGSLLLAFTLAPRLWRIAAAHNFLTVGDYLEYRYDRSVRRLVAGVLWLGALAILAGQLIAMAWILDVVAQAPKWLGCLLGGLVVTGYFSLGGLVSTAWVNVAQLAIKLAGFLLAVPFAIQSAGGWEGVTNQLAVQPSFRGDLTEYLSVTGRSAESFGYLVLLVPAFLVSPGILQKVYGARDSGVARNGVLLNAFGLLLFAALPPLLGIVAHSFYPELPNQELALPTLMVHQMPFWLGALALGAVFSAELSAADAVLAMLSTSFARDWVQGYWRPELSSTELLRVTRLVSIGAGLLGVLLALWLPNVVSALQIFYGLSDCSAVCSFGFWPLLEAPKGTCSSGSHHRRGNRRVLLATIWEGYGPRALVPGGLWHFRPLQRQ